MPCWKKVARPWAQAHDVETGARVDALPHKIVCRILSLADAFPCVWGYGAR